MEKLERYRQIIKETLHKHSQVKPAYGEVQMKLLFDQERDRYQLLRTGWQEERRVYGALIHLEIEGGKIWIQYDGTEVGIADELLEKHIPAEDIVLGYHSPIMRQYDGFAVS